MSNKSKIFGQQKILNHPGSIKNWLDGKDNTLITAEIDMTNNCNSNCPYCVGARTNQASLTLKEAKSYIDQLKQFGTKGIIFTGGGEPTLKSATLGVVKHIKRIGLDIGFITNGLIMTDEVVKTILENCAWCRISLDAGTSEMYKKTHGQGEKFFNKVLVNTKKLTKAKKKLGNDCAIGVGYLTGKDSVGGMEDFARVTRTLGVDYAQFRPYHNDFTNISEELKKCKKYETRDFKIVASVQKYSRFKDKVKRPYDKCYGVNFCTVICADGTVQTCCHTRGKEKYALGNLKKESFEKIWRNRKRIFRKIDFSDCGPLFCRADEFNRLLFEIKQEKQHINFL